MIDAGVARFALVHGAERAFAAARDRTPAAAWLRDSAFVEVHRDGRIVIRGTVLGHYVDVDGVGDFMGDDTAVGAIAGAVAGFAFGPAVFATGLVGGATLGGMIEAMPMLDGPGFDAVREHVPEGSSAIVVISETERVQTMAEALAGTADTFTHYRLSPATEADLRSALADVPAAQPPTAPTA